MDRAGWKTPTAGAARIRAQLILTDLLDLFIPSVNIAAGFTNQDLLAFRAGNLHVGLIGAQVGFITARAKGPAARFTDQRLFAKAALDHPNQTIRKNVVWKGLVFLPSSIACGLAARRASLRKAHSER
jgi:hypothetical protein